VPRLVIADIKSAPLSLHVTDWLFGHCGIVVPFVAVSMPGYTAAFAERAA
jgi:hypothetical protein